MNDLNHRTDRGSSAYRHDEMPCPDLAAVGNSVRRPALSKMGTRR